MKIDIQPAFPNKQRNRNRIFQLIHEHEKISRQAIVSTLDLSLPTVNQYLEHLIGAELISEDGLIESASVGRKAKALSVNAAARIGLGMDVTQNHVSIVAVDLCGHVRSSIRKRFIFSDDDTGYAGIGEILNSFIASLDSPLESVLGLGISLPAIISSAGDRVCAAALISNAYDFFERIAPYCPVSYRLYNDANAGGFSEICARRNVQRMIYLSLSHSIGGAIIENDRIVEGNNCSGGEFGHMILVPNGVKCHCGQLGCANSYCSPDVLAAHTGDDLDAFFQKLAKNDGKCKKSFEQYLEHLSILVHNIHSCFDCDIVIGGGMGQYINLYINLLREKVQAKDSFGASDADFLKSCYYPFDASAVGAALFFVKAFIDSI